MAVTFAISSARGTRLCATVALFLVAAVADAKREHVFDIPQRTVATLRHQLILDVPHGTLQIEESDDNQLHISGTKVISADGRERAEILAGLTDVALFEDDLACRILVEIPGPPKRGFWDWMFGVRESVGVDLHVAVPKNAALRIRTTSADVSATGLAGPLRVHSASGDVRLLDVGPGVYVEVVHGNVHVEDAHGSVIVEGAHSDVTLRRITGDCNVDLLEGDLEAADLRRNVDVQTHGGDVRLDDLRGNLRLTTTSGNAIVRNVRGDMRTHLMHGHLDVELEPRQGRYYEMTSRTGDLSVRLLGHTPFRLHAQAPDGTLKGNIPGMTYQQQTSHEIRGQVDDSGGPHVHLRSDEGDVHVCCPARESSGGCSGDKPRS